MLTLIRFVVLLSLALATPVYSAEKAVPELATISKGMKLTEALKILGSEGIHAEELFRAVASRDPKMQLKEFVIHPEFRSSDALIVVANSPIVGKPNYIVSELQWHLNWADESKFPYMLRGNKVLYLDGLQISVLKDLPAEVKKNRKNFKPDHNPFE